MSNNQYTPEGEKNGISPQSMPYAPVNPVQPQPIPYAPANPVQPQPIPYAPANPVQPQPMPYAPANPVQPQPVPYTPANPVQPQPMPYTPANPVQPQPMPYAPANPVQPQPMTYAPENQYMVYSAKYGYIAPEKLQKKLVRRDVNILSFVTLAMFAASLVLGLASGIFMVAGSGIGLLNDSEFYYALSAATVVIGTGTPFVLYALISKFDASKSIGFKKVGAFNAIQFTFAGAGLCLLGNYPSQWIAFVLENLGFTVSSASEPSVTTPLSFALLMFSTAILPPIFEEFAFRGVLLSSLRKYGDVFAIITSSVIFGLMHMSVTSIPFAIIAGIIMGYIYVKTGNIWVNIAVHAINNTIAVCSVGLYGLLPEGTANLVNNCLFYGTIILGIICLIVLAVRHMLKGGIEKTKMLISSGDKALCAITNPGFIGLFLICVGYAVITLISASM